MLRQVRTEPTTFYEAERTYRTLGTDYPTHEDLPVLRKLQAIVRTRIQGDYGRVVNGWLHYEHALVLQGLYPDRAYERYIKAHRQFNLAQETKKSPPATVVGNLNRDILMAFARTELSAPEKAMENRYTTLTRLAGLIHSCVVAATGSISELEIGDYKGRMSEMAVAAVGMLPSDSKSRMVLPGTLRQESPLRGEDKLNQAIDLNVLVYENDGRVIMHGDPEYLQVKFRDKRSGSDRPNGYAPHIHVVYADELLGLQSVEDYGSFAMHLKKFTATECKTDYLETAEANLEQAMMGTMQPS